MGAYGPFFYPGYQNVLQKQELTDPNAPLDPNNMVDAMRAYMARQSVDDKELVNVLKNAPEETTDPAATPPAPPPQELGIKPVGDFGMGRIQRQIEGEVNKPSVSQETRDGLSGELDKRRKIADDTVGEFNRVQAQVMGLAATQETITRVQREAESSARRRLEQVSKKASYPSLSIQEIERLEAVQSDTKGKYTPEQKRAAELSLKRASEIDPQRLLGSTGNRILAALAAGLGAYGAAMARTPNFALQIISDTIDRDIAAQKSAFDSGERAYAREKSLYAELRGQFETDIQAIQAQRAMMMNSAALIADKYGMEDKSAELRVKAKEAEINVAQDEKARRLDALTKAGQMANMRTQNALEGQRNQIAANKQKDANNAMVPGGTKPIDGEQFTDNRVAQNASYKVMSQYGKLNTLLSELISTRGKLGPEVLNRIGVADAESLWSMVFSAAREYNATGAHLSPGEVEVIEKQIGKGATSFEFLIPKLQSLQRNLKKATNAQLRAAHIQLDESDTRLDEAPLEFGPPR